MAIQHTGDKLLRQNEQQKYETETRKKKSIFEFQSAYRAKISTSKVRNDRPLTAFLVLRCNKFAVECVTTQENATKTTERLEAATYIQSHACIQDPPNLSQYSTLYGTRNAKFEKIRKNHQLTTCFALSNPPLNCVSGLTTFP